MLLRVLGTSGRPLVCAALEVETNLEFRPYYEDRDDLICRRYSC
jgi:hypothetical protein